MKKLLFLLFIAAFGQNIAQSNYRFRNYTINDGLSQSAITAIIQDEIGTLWIGTQDGLNRFDGQSFENFTSDKTEGLENDYIHSSIKAKDGKLWFGTANGLTYYDPLIEVFKTFQLKGNIALQIESLVEDNQGNIWFGSAASGLYFLKKNGKQIQGLKTNLPSNKIKFVALKNNHELFVSTEDKGLFSLNIKSKKATPIKIAGKKGSFVRVNTMRELANGWWMIGSNQGLYLIDYRSNIAVEYLPSFDKNYGLLDVSDIEIESDNRFFVASQSQGLFSVEIQEGKPIITQSTNDIFQKNSLIDNDLNVIFKDKKGTFWLGTNRGLGSFDPINAGFLSIGASGDLSKGIPSPNVWCFGEDINAKYLFVGTDNAISKFDKSTGKFQQYFKSTPKVAQGSNGETSILSILVLSENNLLVGATDGLFALKISGSNCHYEKIKFDKIKNPSNFERVYSIVFWKDNLYFLATKGGVLLYDRSKNNFTVFEHNPKKKNETITPGVCRMIYKDLSGNIWFTTSVGGLNVLKENGDKLSIVPSKFNSIISSLSKDYITHINQCTKNVLWLGTMGSGIIRLDLKNNKGQIFSKKNGLPNNVIYGILNDKKGNLWLTTNKGISKFNIFTNEATNFTEVDGLLSNEFNQGAFLNSKSGMLFFGGISGFNYFNPNTINNVSRKIEVSFTKIKLDANWLKPNDETKILKTTISNTSHIDLTYRQRSFTLKIMAVDLSNPDLVSYKYKLEGSDEGEIFMGNFNQIHFNSLQPGEYVLHVYARLGHGEWSDDPAKLEIVIATPFWQTAWFWIIIIFLLGIIVFVLIRKRIDNERREQVRLEMKIAERTKEIRLQNVKIEKQKRTIEEKKDKLEEQKKLLEIEKEKTERLLKNIIPESTYEELKNEGKAQARAFKSVSVMFSDFVGFTKIAEKMKPSDLVNQLDIYFRKFDEIIVKNNLEKIKTIGDAYMCAGGVPVRNITNPIDACIAALQIQDYVKSLRLKAEKNNQIIWDLRLGINTGEVTAGVIGSEKLQYDIWGSTVNQAQRMEMLGEPGTVNISGNTFKYIEPYFACAFRGKAMSKSKGYVEMYTVVSIKPELSIDGKGLKPNEKFKQIMNLHFYSSINYYKAEKHIMKVLEKKLSPKLHYHCVEHTRDVCHAIERLALSEGITDEGLFLLKSAATYHDAGFVESYEDNEPVGARLAEEILPNFGYSESHIEQIKELIYVTQIPHNPQNHLEEIICDADLDYLGRSDFHQIADKLRRELREHGKIDSDRKWDEIQVGFLESHRYFTETAKVARNEKKAQNLQEIKDRLARNEYVD
jgi:ligand-binding sensor domain-containing protein/class 3 adenylate cyclase/predicted metal-dependent HD superfamily phosphohydrolase